MTLRLWLVLPLLVLAVPAAAPAAAGPDFQVASLTPADTSLAAGERLTVTVAVLNAGRKAAPRSTVQVLLSKDRRRSRDDRLLGTASVRALGIAGTRRVRVIGTLPAALTGRTYLFACSDAARRVREANEKNNCRGSSRPVRVIAETSPAAPAPGPRPTPTATPGPSPVPTPSPTATASPTPTPSPEPPAQTRVTVARDGAGSGAVTSVPAGIACPPTCRASFPAHQEVLLSAAPASGSYFQGWGGACSGTGTCTIAPGEAVVVASFEQTVPPAVASVLINEIHADPHPTEGDANNDGFVDSVQDEFVELVNVTTDVIDLAGATISDSAQVRHVFGSTILLPGCPVVLFGGGTPTGPWGRGLVIAGGPLSLNNEGDQVTLAGEAGVIDTKAYPAPDAGADVSITRSPDLGETWTAHAFWRFSPTLRVNRTPFNC